MNALSKIYISLLFLNRLLIYVKSYHFPTVTYDSLPPPDTFPSTPTMSTSQRLWPLSLTLIIIYMDDYAEMHKYHLQKKCSFFIIFIWNDLAKLLFLQKLTFHDSLLPGIWGARVTTQSTTNTCLVPYNIVPYTCFKNH